MTRPGGRAADRVRGRVLAEVAPMLGPRWGLVAEGEAPLPRGVPDAAVVVSLDGAARGVRAVRGAPGAIPVLSEALTGVFVAAPGGAGAVAPLRECARLLQPGGAVVLWSAWRADEVPALDGAFAGAGLEVRRRIAVLLADEPAPAAARWWPALAMRRAAAAAGAERVECAIVAVRPGRGLVEIPTAGSLLAEMFVPRAWRRVRPATPA